MMNDLRIEARCRNNVLWHAIYDVYPSVAAFCRAHNLNHQTISELLNLARNPYHVPRRTDRDELIPDLTPLARQLCEITGLGKDELFPAVLYAGVIPSRRVAEVSSAQFPRPLTAGMQPLLPPTAETELIESERRMILNAVLHTLTPREEFIIRLRFGLNGGDPQTLAEVADVLQLSRETIRHVEARALVKLRHPSRAQQLRPIDEAE